MVVTGSLDRIVKKWQRHQVSNKVSLVWVITRELTILTLLVWVQMICTGILWWRARKYMAIVKLF